MSEPESLFGAALRKLQRPAELMEFLTLEIKSFLAGRIDLQTLEPCLENLQADQDRRRLVLEALRVRREAELMLRSAAIAAQPGTLRSSVRDEVLALIQRETGFDMKTDRPEDIDAIVARIDQLSSLLASWEPIN